MVAQARPHGFLKGLGLIACMIMIEVICFPIWALVHDGCTKYVPLEGLQSLYVFAWKFWAVGVLASLTVLLIFLSDFLRRPRLLGQGTAVASFASLTVWKVLALASDLQEATNCGEARDYDFPRYLTWMNETVLVALCFAAWGATIICATTSVAEPGKVKQA